MLQRLAADRVHWDYLSWLAEVHSVLPLVHWTLKDIRVDGAPPEFIARLPEHFSVSALRNRMLFAEYRKLADLLAANDIEFIALKGITLASTIYEDSTLRQFADIDVLLHERDIDTTRRLLEAQGLRPVHSHGILAEGATGLSPFQDAIYRAFYHQYELNSGDGLIYVDVHWRLSPRVYPANVTSEMAWRRSVAADIQGRTVRVLQDECSCSICARTAPKTDGASSSGSSMPIG